ncbi:MAG: T9SS type A sorting domain-containing protein [Bacteroidetes bacterium]|nr:T9SS type A sorting domain-containing protein [Bacteroidota bacterium]MBI3501596.1 T9SS type A sorting domain-containing protein [Bacteroidota bacterium]
MKKITLPVICATFLFVGYKNLPEPMSNGAPESSTAAPGERHCATSGCHATFPINSGNANVSIYIGSGTTHYEPGKKYPVSVSISSAGKMRFGFQLTVLKNSDNTPAGTISLTDTKRTQLQAGFGNFSERKYITYTYEGTNATATGLGKWDFEWTAPETNEGDVSFYAAVIEANNDGTDDGDYAYTRKISIAAPETFWKIFPTVSSSQFNVQSSELVIDLLKIYTSSGEIVYEKTNIEPGTLNLELSQSGIYFVSVSHDGKTEVQKILIAR